MNQFNDSNYTMRFPRTLSESNFREVRSSEWGGNWARNSHRIPVVAWIGAAAVIAVIFIVVPYLGHAAGL